MNRIERALISVFDKSGIAEFAGGLAELGVGIVSTGNTARRLRDEGIKVTDVSELTGFPEMMDGRVKTLHPNVHAGVLARRDNSDDIRQLGEHGIGTIDLVCTNLYPFVETTELPDVVFDQVVENIDIGGPSMIRAGAKNFRDVAVVTDPGDYGRVLDQMRQTDCKLSAALLLELAQKAFVHTAQYDGAIAQYLSGVKTDGKLFQLPEDPEFPDRMFMDLRKLSGLRYGENPHQRAAFYGWGSGAAFGMAAAEQLQGKELSYNNLVDIQAAWGLIQEFDEPACAIIKHTNPCGTALGNDLREAYLSALESDPVSAFGSVIAVNRTLDSATAEEMAKIFVEAVVAPEVDPEAAALFAAKRNLRLLRTGAKADSPGVRGMEIRNVAGGLLVQSVDDSDELSGSSIRTVTSRKPTDEEWRDLHFAWRVSRHVKSNAIVLARGGRTVGVGAGQMSRVDSVRLSVDKARPGAEGAVLASDAFFPFRDGVDEAAKAGVRAIIQPGGSRRDEEVIQAAEEHGLAMVMTDTRHFKH